MVNGTQVSTALAVAGLFAAEEVFAAALLAGCLTLEAALGQDMAFDERLQRVRGQAGQSGRRRGLSGPAGGKRDPAAGAGRGPHAGPLLPALPAPGHGRLPGATFASLGAHARWTKSNAVSDNPLVFRRRRRNSLRRQFPRRARRPSPPTCIAIAAWQRSAPSAERRIALLMDKNSEQACPHSWCGRERPRIPASWSPT